MRPRIRGVLPAALTPFKDDLSVDFHALVTFYKYLLNAGCDGIVAMGTTGEANSLSQRERLGVIEHVAEAGLSGKVIMGTGCCNLPDTAALSKAAFGAGAAGILIMPPFFYRAVDQEGIFAAYAHTIEMIGAQLLPLYLYDFPKMSGIDIALETIARLRDAFPGVISGLKNSSGDFAEMKQQNEAFDDFDVFCGSEQFLLDGLRAGFAGCISASFNVNAADGVATMQNWQGPGAEALQEVLNSKRKILEQHVIIAAAKGLQARWSGDQSWLNMRPPLMPLNDEQISSLERQLEVVGPA